MSGPFDELFTRVTCDFIFEPLLILSEFKPQPTERRIHEYHTNHPVANDVRILPNRYKLVVASTKDKKPALESSPCSSISKHSGPNCRREKEKADENGTSEMPAAQV
jgi:hypothetical protein